MHLHRSLLIGLLLSGARTTIPNNLSAIQVPAGADAARNAFILQAMKDAGIPGLQTVVVKNGRVVWQKSYGQAVLAQPGPPTPMRDTTVMFTCSIGKIPTVIAVMQQVEKGRLSLDDDINRYLPFVVRNPRWPDVPITWRMLLTHTSSINDDLGVEDSIYTYGEDSRITFEDYMVGTFTPGGVYNRPDSYLPGKPGTERIYSNNAVDLAGYALGRLVHEPFTQYVTREIFQPLKMMRTSFFLRDLSAGLLAVGYGRVKTAGGRFVFSTNRVAFAHVPAGRTVLDEQYSGPDPPSGVLYSTAGDFARLALMLLNRGSLDGAKILEPASVDLLLTHSGFWSIYGFQQGLVFLGGRDLDYQLVWGHDGEDRGYITAIFFNPATKIGAVAFANANSDDFLLSGRLVDLDMHLMDWFK